MKFDCPHCQVMLEIDDSFAGAINCPTCGQSFVIPALEPPIAEEGSVQEESIPPASETTTPPSNPAPKFRVVSRSAQANQTESISRGDGPFARIDAGLEKAMGLLDNHPWERWVAVANDFIGKWLPFVIAAAGVAGFLIGFISCIRYKAPFGTTVANLAFLALALLSMHLAPKALALPRAFLDKREPDPMRPELLYIFKALHFFGALIWGISLILMFDSDLFWAALIVLVSGALLTIVFGNPGLIGVKAAHPQNAIEEVLCILLLPIKVVLSLLTLVIGLGTVGLFVYGIVELCRSNYGGIETLPLFGMAIGAPVLIPLAVYLVYLLLMFTLDFYRAIVSVPRKLDDVRKAIEGKH